MIDELRARALTEVEQGHLPSCQFAVAFEGKVLVEETVGDVPSDARYVCFSSTKPVVASVVWQLIGESLLDPEKPVTTWWPEFGANGKDRVTLDHVLQHTAGFPLASLERQSGGDRADRVRRMEAWTLDWEPGTRFEYHGLSAHWVLAELITRVTEEEYRVALRKRVLDPLGLDRLELGVPPERQGDVQPVVETMEPPSAEEIKRVLGIEDLSELEPEREPADPVDLMAFAEPESLAAGVPGAGAVGDAGSLALFYQALLHNPGDLWDPAVLKDVTGNARNQFKGPFGGSAMRSRGLEIAGADEFAHIRLGFGVTSPAAFGHGGAGGQVAWADPKTGLSFVFLTGGMDRHFIRAHRRGRDLSALANRCLES
ncbi:serine hydrolase domain-containing protein [Streptomyces sp. NPDC013978]|uniref:serine hydrolase domain-containing protein n=1 Tax=Streptomyces sp. NPDC013978 TaxID=3364869 RepID=UPI0036FBAB5E